MINGGERGSIEAAYLIVLFDLLVCLKMADHTLDHTLNNHPLDTAIRLPPFETISILIVTSRSYYRCIVHQLSVLKTGGRIVPSSLNWPHWSF